MKILLISFLLFSAANAVLKFDWTTLYDMYDFQGTPEYHITDCIGGCLVYVTYVQDEDGLGDQVNGPITMSYVDTDGNTASATFFDLIRAQEDNGEKGYFDVLQGTRDVVIKNPNANAITRPLAVWIVPYRTPLLQYIQIFEAADGAQISAHEHRVVLMRVEPYTINADIEGPDYELFVSPSPIDMNSCEYVFKFNNTIGPGFSLPVNSPIMSFGFNSGFDFNISMSIDFDFPTQRSINASGYFASPGYIGCADKNAVFRSDSYNTGVASYNEAFVVEGDTIQNVTFYGDLNTDESTPIVLIDGDTDEQMILFGTQEDGTSSWDYNMTTSKFTLSWDDDLSKEKKSFMIRYEVNSTTTSSRSTMAPKTTVTSKTTVPTVPTVATVPTTTKTLAPEPTSATASATASSSTITSTITPTTSLSGSSSVIFTMISIVSALLL